MKNSSLSKKSPRARRTLTPEFKAEAVRLAEESGGAISKIARELNIYESTCGRRRYPAGGVLGYFRSWLLG
jgi:transposase-like protein